jgi:uncharacterized protein Yka (UPF0111/DUF47 family)
MEVGGVKRQRWFLPESPDVLGLLQLQVAATVEGIDAFAAWAGGDAAAADTVRVCEHRADKVKRELLDALRAAFVIPLEPEDVFAMSRGVDWMLNRAKDTINEAEVMACPPDAALADMTALLAEAVRHLEEAVDALKRPDDDPTGPAEAAIKAERNHERAYRAGMAALLEIDDLREVTARRELYRRCARIGEGAVDVAERVIYAVVKES